MSTNSKLNMALAQAQAQVPECIAVGYVDMDTGMLLGVKTTDGHSNEILDFVAAATQDMFEGQNIITIERLFAQRRGATDSPPSLFTEIFTFSPHVIHAMLRGQRNAKHVVVFVCRCTANLGMVISKARLVLPTLEAAAS